MAAADSKNQKWKLEQRRRRLARRLKTFGVTTDFNLLRYRLETERTKAKYYIEEGTNMNIYIGNLSWEVTEEDVRHAFEGFGQVASATIIRDSTSGRSRGFGFVEMPNKAEADAAITGLNGKELKGRKVIVNEARPRSEGRRDDGKKPSL